MSQTLFCGSYRSKLIICGGETICIISCYYFTFTCIYSDQTNACKCQTSKMYTALEKDEYEKITMCPGTTYT